MPYPPYDKAEGAYLYLQAPWIENLSPYDMPVTASGVGVVKHDGRYFFNMGDTSYIRLANKDKTHPIPRPDNEIAMEIMFRHDIPQAASTDDYCIISPYIQGPLMISMMYMILRFDGISNRTILNWSPDKTISVPKGETTHILLSYRDGDVREFVNGTLTREIRGYIDTASEYDIRSFNVGSYQQAYQKGFDGMLRYVRIWKYAKNFDVDGFTPDR